MTRSNTQTVKDFLNSSNTEFDFCLSFDFKNALKQSHNPFIMIFIGNYRLWKSIRLNQFLSRNIRGTKIFQTERGAEPQTKGFQFCGTITLTKLGNIHGIKLLVQSNPEVFLIDCEGLACIKGSTPTL
jgi:hypothetical protein